VSDGKTRYGFSSAINGYFEFPTENARRILPPHLEPVELHHGTSVFAMTVFDFTESEVGPYGEAVMAIVVAPRVERGERLPKAAMYPYRVATTTRAAREHAIERWHLPHWMEDVAIEWRREGARVSAQVSAEGEPVAELSITERSWAPISQVFQAFMSDDSGSYLAKMQFDGEQSEHENEEGRLVLAEHPFNRELAISDVYDVPFRELWMRNGVQTFDPLRTLPRA
jgi:hypothetical protein